LKVFEATCLKANKCMGFHVIDPDYTKVQEKMEDGYKFLAFSTDFLFMGGKATDEMKKIKAIL
jgi:2-dehydro-3-deoxyglucarate aldolase